MYCIASASFKNEKDALAEKRQLEMIGFEAEIIAMKNATRYQVIIGKYEKYQDAVNELKFAKNIDKKFYLLTVKENK
jgi:cell division protein FtsN